jgi:hypothetical protein
MTLSSVAAHSSHQVWSVGSILPAGEQSVQPFIASWNGSSWRVVSSPPAPDQTLSAVTVISAHDVWAVGSVIEHWDGKTWQRVEGLESAANHELAHGSRIDVWA